MHSNLERGKRNPGRCGYEHKENEKKNAVNKNIKGKKNSKSNYAVNPTSPSCGQISVPVGKFI